MNEQDIKRASQYVTAISPNHSGSAERCTTKCPLCNRIRLSYQDLKYHVITAHKLTGINIQYRNELLTYSWGERNASGQGKNLL